MLFLYFFFSLMLITIILYLLREIIFKFNAYIIFSKIDLNKVFLQKIYCLRLDGLSL